MWRSSPKSHDTAPPWAHELVIVECRRRGIPAPRLRFLPPSGVFDYGGRYFPEEHAIAVIDVGDTTFVRGVLCHELAHAIDHRSNGAYGAHDARFYALARQVYMEYGVSLATAKAIEDNPIPEAWRKRTAW